MVAGSGSGTRDPHALGWDSPSGPASPQALGICSENSTTQRAAQLVAEELDLLLVDLTSHPSPQTSAFIQAMEASPICTPWI